MKKLYVFLTAVLLPATALAQNTSQFDKLINRIMLLASQAITFLMLVATIVFIWSIIKLILAKKDDELKQAKSQLKWSIIGLAAMVCVWGLIKFAASTLGVSTDNTDIKIPCPPGTNQVLIEGRMVCR